MNNDLIFQRRRKKIIEYRSQGKTLQEIGEIFNLTRERIRQILLPPKPPKIKLPKQIKTKDLKIVDLFPFLKNLKGRGKIREIIRIYYNHTCQKCGKKWTPGILKKRRKFDVHHFSCDPNDSRKYDKDWSEKTVILLCHKCHLSLPEHREKMLKVNRVIPNQKSMDHF